MTPPVCGQSKPVYPIDDGQLSVLKAIEKKPNSNLIDLSVFENIEDKSNVRVSVLEAFDPLLVKTEDISCNLMESREGNLFLLIFYYFTRRYTGCTKT